MCPCPLPVPDNNFAISCGDGPAEQAANDAGGICVCKENYVGPSCEFCGPGYYGEPQTPGE